VSETQLGLRVDVDTFRGTRDGVPRLIDTFAKHGVSATFFFTVGPDNMGRHLFRLLKPRFFVKMLRSRAASLYGWDVLVAGTFWPGKKIGAALGATLRATEKAGHEVGLHAWDHHRWQVAALTMDARALHDEIARGVDAFAEVLGRRPDCSAAAGWVSSERVLEAKEEFGFRYNSDCRGRSIFVPTVNGRRLAPQIPVTLPTYDEVVGRGGVTNDNYNDWLLARIEPGAFNVLTVHAEVEGGACAEMFDAFLGACSARGIRPRTLRELLAANGAPDTDELALAPIEGREGDVGWQRSALAAAQRTAPGRSAARSS
jgi:undecaprenyl phosphate-alpha-L-ara4FN deformylase